MVDLVVTSILPLSIFVGLPIVVWVFFMLLRWYRGYRRPREWLKQRSNATTSTNSSPPRPLSVVSVSDLVAEGKRSTCAACDHDYWYEGTELHKEPRAPRPWESLPNLGRPHRHNHKVVTTNINQAKTSVSDLPDMDRKVSHVVTHKGSCTTSAYPDLSQSQSAAQIARPDSFILKL